jgi:hypothetical protein
MFLVVSSCLVLCLFLSCLVLSCLVLSCLCLVSSCLVLSCLVFVLSCVLPAILCIAATAMRSPLSVSARLLFPSFGLPWGPILRRLALFFVLCLLAGCVSLSNCLPFVNELQEPSLIPMRSLRVRVCVFVVHVLVFFRGCSLNL